MIFSAFRVVPVVKNLPAMRVRHKGWKVQSLGRSPGGGYGNPLQYSCLETPMDRRGWRVTVHSVAKSWTRLKPLSTHASTNFGSFLQVKFLQQFCLCVCVCVHVLSCFSCVQLCATLWTLAYHAPLSVGLSRQEYWSGWLCPPPGDCLDPGIKPTSLKSNLHWQASSLPAAPPGKPLSSSYFSSSFSFSLKSRV